MSLIVEYGEKLGYFYTYKELCSLEVVKKEQCELNVFLNSFTSEVTDTLFRFEKGMFFKEKAVKISEYCAFGLHKMVFYKSGLICDYKPKELFHWLNAWRIYNIDKEFKPFFKMISCPGNPFQSRFNPMFEKSDCLLAIKPDVLVEAAKSPGEYGKAIKMAIDCNPKLQGHILQGQF